MTNLRRICLQLSVISIVLLSASACTSSTSSADLNTEYSDRARSSDIVARVGDENINYSLLNTMLNSSAMVGLSVPPPGTAERKYVITTLLDKAITANLLYLDAKKSGIDQDRNYQRELTEFKRAVLVSLYKYKKNFEDTVLTEKIRDEIRKGIKVKIDKIALDPSKDKEQCDNKVVVFLKSRLDSLEIKWAEVEPLITLAANSDAYAGNDGDRLKRLNRIIDNRIMAYKAHKAGLEKHPSYIRQLEEFSKTRLINLHRADLIQRWSTNDNKFAQYSASTINRISVSGTDGSVFARQLEELSGANKTKDNRVLVKAFNVQEGHYKKPADNHARRRALRSYLQEQFNQYVQDLRTNMFEVEVDATALNQQFEREANLIAALSTTAMQQGFVTGK